MEISCIAECCKHDVCVCVKSQTSGCLSFAVIPCFSERPGMAQNTKTRTYTKHTFMHPIFRVGLVPTPFDSHGTDLNPESCAHTHNTHAHTPSQNTIAVYEMRQDPICNFISDSLALAQSQSQPNNTFLTQRSYTKASVSLPISSALPISSVCRCLEWGRKFQ